MCDHCGPDGPGPHNISESSNVIQYYWCKSELGAVHTGACDPPPRADPSSIRAQSPLSLPDKSPAQS